MKVFQTVVFVLVMMLTTTQTMRHVYLKWVAPDGSALDRFRSETESDIAAARSLEELIPAYAAAKAKVEAYEADPANPTLAPYRQQTTEPYESEIKLRKAIERREAWERKLMELWFFWIAGAASVVLGIVVLRRVNEWLGMSGILVGYAEMAYWTSPLVDRKYAGAEFETLLDIKLLLSAVTMTSVIVLWLLARRSDHR